MSSVWSNNSDLFNEYVTFIKKQKITALSTEILNGFDQIHAGGIKATQDILQNLAIKEGDRILELGGGLGGVARLIAKKYRSFVVNLDLSIDYTVTGKRLTELCDDCKGVFFITADATNCPLKENSFELVWLQHVNMNIENKKQMFSEIGRLLKKKGYLVFHEWFLSGMPEEIKLPLPWADDMNLNHLCSFDEFANLAKKEGFEIEFFKNETDSSLSFYRKLLDRKAYKNPVFRKRDGETTFINTVRMLETKTLSVYSGKMIKIR